MDGLIDGLLQLHVSPCMHACMYLCMYVCTYACMYVCMSACMYVCMHACMYACVHEIRYDCHKPTYIPTCEVFLPTFKQDCQLALRCAEIKLIDAATLLSNALV